MKKYLVTLSLRYEEIVEVEANNEAEAQAEALRGNFVDLGISDYVETLGIAGVEEVEDVRDDGVTFVLKRGDSLV